MKEKLLVLDDESLILRSLENLFDDEYEVFTATEAEMALALAREHDMAVIVTDERMAGVNGHEFLQRVKEVSRGTRVMMSGYADMAALTEAVNCGQIFAYIAKPWEPLQLRAKVAAATAHFKLVQEMEQERGLLRALMENIPDLIYFKDCQSRFTRVNQAFAQFLGAKDPAECIGGSDSDYFAPAEAVCGSAYEAEIVRSGRPQVDRIEQIQEPRGALHWMSTTKVPMFERSGLVSGIAGISRDITALKNSEERLREQNEHNRMIIETAKDAFIGMDPDGSITAWNAQAELTFGWSAKEVIGRRLCDTVVPVKYRVTPAPGVEDYLSTAQDPTLNRAIELVALHRDGHEFPVEATIWRVRAGGVCSFNAFVRDITERRRAEEARKKESTLVQLLQCLTVAANRSSSIEHTAQTCLARICAHTGWAVGHVYLRAANSAEELVSTELWHLQDDDKFAVFRDTSNLFRLAPGTALSRSILSSGKPQWVVNLADEEPLSERTRVALQAGLRSGFGFPILVEDKVMGVLEFFSLQAEQSDAELLDMLGHIGSQLGQVIIRQRAEEDLRRAKALAESANRAKSEFLTTMSHEMRTPMNAILGMADLLSDSPLRDEQRHYVRVFQKAGTNLLALINDILDLSKVESGYFELESIGFDLRALLEKIIEMMIPQAQNRGLELTWEVHRDVPLGLVGDANRVQQILVNLIGNALKFTEQGSVRVRVEREQGGAADSLRFEVADTGIGICPEKTAMIFDRFTQADSSTTRNYGGTGLGLAISKGLVELMGGRIGCVSEPGKGSTFYFTAPFEARKEIEMAEVVEPAAIAAPVTKDQQASRILIVEDSEFNLALIKAYLKDSGFELDFAENGKVAVEKVMSGGVHLVLMDLQMPVMGGLEATRLIRRWEAHSGRHPVPILALTAQAAGEGVGRSLDAGCNEHLTKPIKKSTLLEAMSRHLQNKIRITPPDGIEGLVPKYLLNIRRDMEAILAAVEGKDCRVAQRLGHQFKGSGEGYGFPEISRTGAALEVAAAADNADEIRNQIVSLASYLDRVEIVWSEQPVGPRV
ncbi:MAG TPA: response regulator [Bryobacteraceae bacterium]|nr:response regulator [Bryobacteraceae bacterium]